MSVSLENYAPPAPGTIFASKYEIVRPLGKGGMGVVLEAKHARLGQAVAIKLLKPELLSDGESVMRFEREARAAARLTSPHAARIYDVDTTPEGIPFMVMEYLEGRDLARILQEQQVLGVEDAVDWVMQACAAMAEAHALGIVHRDLKPSNLFLAENVATGAIVKVLDFGISKITVESEQQLTTTATVLGTPHYMSPEQVTASRVVDLRADIWALSVILYRALTKAFPFVGPNPTALAVSIATERAIPIQQQQVQLPEALMNAIMKGLEKNPADRHQSVHELAAAIEGMGSGRWHVPAASALRVNRHSFPPGTRESTGNTGRRSNTDGSGPRRPITGPSGANGGVMLIDGEPNAETRSTWGGGSQIALEAAPPKWRRVIALPAAALSVLALVGSAAYLYGSRQSAAVAPATETVSAPKVISPSEVAIHEAQMQQAQAQAQAPPQPTPTAVTAAGGLPQAKPSVTPATTAAVSTTHAKPKDPPPAAIPRNPTPAAAPSNPLHL